MVQPQSVNEVTPALSGMSIMLIRPVFNLYPLNLLETTIPRIQSISNLSLLVAGTTAQGSLPGVPRDTSQTDYNCKRVSKAQSQERLRALSRSRNRGTVYVIVDSVRPMLASQVIFSST